MTRRILTSTKPLLDSPSRSAPTPAAMHRPPFYMQNFTGRGSETATLVANELHSVENNARNFRT